MTETTALYAAIAALFGILSTLAKLAWDERGRRLESAETQSSYYRDEIPQLIDGLITAQKQMETSVHRLTDVVEEALKRMNGAKQSSPEGKERR